MKITKYAHACLFVDNGGQRLVIDPGEYTELPDDLSNIGTVVITHVHADHAGKENVVKIVAANPGVKIYGLKDTLDSLEDSGGKKCLVPKSGEVKVEGFNLKFYIHDHAVIYGAVPCQNFGVKVDSVLYYPGDSYHAVEDEVAAVAVPISGPWSKTSDAIDLAKAMKAKQFFGTHDAHLSERGIGSAETWITRFLEGTGKKYVNLKVGESIEL